MRSTTLFLMRDRHNSSVAAVAALALAFLLLRGEPAAFAQSGTADRWVGTWTTAEVGRPQTPGAAGAGASRPSWPTPGVRRRRRRRVAPPPGQTFAPPPFIHFTNQTLRQIVHTSIGGSKARVVLSNAYGTAPVTIGARAHRASRQTGSHPGRVGPAR